MSMTLCVYLIDIAMYIMLHLAYVMSNTRAGMAGNQLNSGSQELV